ncbi:hypothetical protein BEP19_03540 [Ammoniphilus oxalaticus]|uniref:DUF4179 domain-containing protein n=1 Tax=Ammoniphilus oxalaticus TaxID=66863 RepID=A0A419SNX7_9BACL|nr:DUF4179 domain-containing protein [Ammoniphilus oxalaticus]RKD26010.1 hypothetical protein BEP19_03540 [Ammoniphilus oxalaticus]
MEDRKMRALLNQLDDDLVIQEFDKLMEGVEIDMDSIHKKAHQKLRKHNRATKLKRRKRYSYVAAACLCLIGVTGVYASDISETIKSFMTKTSVYDTVVDGDAYYLKDKQVLNSDITVESVIVSNGNLEMTISTQADRAFEDLGEIEIIPQDGSNTIYYPGGYGGEKDNLFLHFMNKTEGNYNIQPFQYFKLVIGENSYDLSLEKAKALDLDGQIYTAKSDLIDGVNLAASIADGKGKTNIQLVSSFADEHLQLIRFGQPIQTKVIEKFEDRGAEGTIGSSTGSSAEALYVVDGASNKQHKLEIPKNAKGRPVTNFETSALEGKDLTLTVPAIIATSNQKYEPLTLNIPTNGEVMLNKEIDFSEQKAVLKKMKRLSATSAELEFELNTGENKYIDLRSFNFYSPDIKKMSAEFNGNQATMTMEFHKEIEISEFQMSNPSFVMNGNWTIDLKR